MSGGVVQNQSIAIAIILVAGGGLLLSSLVYLKRYRNRQRALAAGSAHQQFYFGPSAVEAGRLGLTPMPITGTGTGTGLRPGRAQAPVNRLPEPAEEGAEELPTYGVALAAKAVEVDGVAYPPAAYVPPGNGSAEPPPYAVQAEARQGEPSRPRRASSS